MGKAKRRAVAGAAAGGQARDWMIAEEELEVGESLGRGWQGETFRCRWKGRDGAVAVKRLDADMRGVAEGSAGEVMERGREELRRMAAACAGCKRVCR